jgi:hypothetical protein
MTGAVREEREFKARVWFPKNARNRRTILLPKRHPEEENAKIYPA